MEMWQYKVSIALATACHAIRMGAACCMHLFALLASASEGERLQGLVRAVLWAGLRLLHGAIQTIQRSRLGREIHSHAAGL